MNFYLELPYDIIEYISKKLYKDFSNKIKKKYQIIKDARLALELSYRINYISIVHNNLNNSYNNNIVYYINNNNYNIIDNINLDNNIDPEMPILEHINN